MDIIIIRAKEYCKRIEFTRLTPDEELYYKKMLLILSNPNNYGLSDIQSISNLKKRVETIMNQETQSKYPPLEWLYKAIQNYDDKEQVVLVDLKFYSNPLAELNQCILNSANRSVINVVNVLQKCKCTDFTNHPCKKSFALFGVIPYHHKLV